MATILSFGGNRTATPDQPRNDLTYEEFYQQYYSYVVRFLVRRINSR